MTSSAWTSTRPAGACGGPSSTASTRRPAQDRRHRAGGRPAGGDPPRRVGARCPGQLAAMPRRGRRPPPSAVLGAGATCPSLEHLVVRSGIAVYGRRRGGATRPDESVPPDPTSPFGRHAAPLERLGRARPPRRGRGDDRPAPRTGGRAARTQPLGRLLRLPAVPVSALADPAFALIDDQDAATAIVAAATGRSTACSTSVARCRHRHQGGADGRARPRPLARS